METFLFFRLRFRRAYDSAHDSDFRFSRGHKRSYDSDYDSVASEELALKPNFTWVLYLGCYFSLHWFSLNFSFDNSNSNSIICGC